MSDRTQAPAPDRKSRRRCRSSTQFLAMTALIAGVAVPPAAFADVVGVWTPTCVTVCERPTARAWATMAYDQAAKSTVLFGGIGGPDSSSLTDTWTWDGATWTRQFPGRSPGLGAFGAMAYDPTTQTSVLYNPWGETWLWSGLARKWTNVTPRVGPAGRQSPSIAYDEARGNVVLFGGSVDGPMNDTWVWNGPTRTWSKQSPVTRPPARDRASMAYDPVTRTVLLFGGRGVAGAPLSDTWTWNGQTWTRQNPTTSPPPRGDAAMAQNVPLRQVILFGGATSNTITGMLGDTWTWDGTRGTWSPSPAAGPGLRQAAAMVYDGASGQNLLFGGLGEPTPCDPRNGCFVFQPNNWLDDSWTYG